MNYIQLYEDYTKHKNSDRRFKLVFRNQSDDSAEVYRLTRETDMYYFLEKIAGSAFTYRVSKKTLKVKAYKEGEEGYAFDVPTAVSLIEMK